jgi:hypothetical protein
LGCHFKPKLSASERKNIQTATNIPASHVPQAIVSIGPAGARVSISVALQGQARPDAGWDVPLTVRFFPPGANVLSDTPTREFQSMTTRSGTAETAVCEAAGVLPGTYDIAIFGESTLMNVKREVVISSPRTSVNLGTLLEGNAHQDNTIDLDDCVVLATSWLASKEQPEYDVRADFDRSGRINAADLLLLAANWLMSSPVDGDP